MIRLLYLDMNMPGATRRETGHDRREFIPTIRNGELMTAQCVPPVAINTGIVTLPEIDQRVFDRMTIGGIDIAGNDQFGARQTRFELIGVFRLK